MRNELLQAKDEAYERAAKVAESNSSTFIEGGRRAFRQDGKTYFLDECAPNLEKQRLAALDLLGLPDTNSAEKIASEIRSLKSKPEEQ